MLRQVATVLLLFTLSGPVKASTYLVRKILPYELVLGSAVLLEHIKLITVIFPSEPSVPLLNWVLYWQSQQ